MICHPDKFWSGHLVLVYNLGWHHFRCYNNDIRVPQPAQHAINSQLVTSYVQLPEYNLNYSISILMAIYQVDLG